MALGALAALAERLATSGQCRFIKPGTTQASSFDHDGSSPDGRSLQQVFRDIDTPGSWVALYNIETDPTYRDFLDEALGGVLPLVERQQPGVFLKTGFIFISAPPSVTPFHIDRENNFWLQIRGRKTLNVWPHTDRRAVSAESVEQFILFRDLSKVKLDERTRAHSLEYDVGPGDGVYFPSTSPHMTRTEDHWCRPGDCVSISIGINFYTSVTRRHAHVHHFNSALRRLGFTPRPPGVSELVDRIKAPLGRWIGKVRYRRHCRDAPPGMY